MVGADAEKETRKLALWPGPAEANRGGRLGREYDVVDGTNKGSQIYGGDAAFRSIRNGGQDTAAWTESRRGKWFVAGVEGSTEYGECCQELSPKRIL